MALVKCPECGNQVSSNSNQCIHCGCKFTACPECGKITIGKLNVCPQCGFDFTKLISNGKYDNLFDNQNAEENSKLNNDLIKTWQQASPADATILRLLKFIKFLVYIIPATFLIILAITYYKWSIADVLEMSFTFSKTEEKIKTMLSLACVFGILCSLCDPIIQAVIKIRCSNWIKKSMIDGIAWLRDIGESKIDTNEAIHTLLVAESIFYAEKYQNRNGIYAGLVIRLLSAIATFISGGICVMQNLTEAMNVKINNGSFAFQYHALIVFGIFAVIWVIVDIVADSLIKKKFNDWLQKTLEDSSAD